MNSWISIPNSPTEGDEGGIFSKAPDWKFLLLLKIEVKQNPGYPDKEYNANYQHIYRNFMPYRRSKKNCTDQWLGKH